MLCLINKSSQFCKTRNKYEVAITCAFGRNKHCTYLYVKCACACNSAHYRVLRYLICGFFLEENCSSVYLYVLRAHFSPVKGSEPIFSPENFTPWPCIREYPHTPFRMPRVRAWRYYEPLSFQNLYNRTATGKSNFRKKVSRWQKIELSSENSVKSYAIIFGYYVNDSLFTANYLCALIIILTSPTAYQSKFIACPF